MKYRKLFTYLFILDVLILNLVLGYAYFVYFKSVNPAKEEISAEKGPELNNGKAEADGCGESCKKEIELAVKEYISEDTVIASVTPTQAPAVKKVRRVFYVPIPGNGSTVQTSWTDLAGTDFYFDKGDYPGFVEGYFEANLKLLNGNGDAMVRIFDATHSIAVNGSEVKTSSQVSVLVVSQKLQFWSGRNLYKIQAKSLTADTTVFESGRLKIVTEE